MFFSAIDSRFHPLHSSIIFPQKKGRHKLQMNGMAFLIAKMSKNDGKKRGTEHLSFNKMVRSVPRNLSKHRGHSRWRIVFIHNDLLLPIVYAHILVHVT